MAEVGNAFVSILPSLRGFGSNMDRQFQPIAKRSGAKFGGLIASSAKLGLAGLAVGATAATATFLKGSISEAREAQKIGAITNQTIKSTGGSAKVSARYIGNLSTAISRKTGIDDEAIQAGENQILTFKNIRREGKGVNDIFARASRGAVDLSAHGFGSIDSASKQLGKALNDPVKGITALSRSGVTFTAQQKNQIKTLVASGNSLKAQKIILKEVESQVGGTAAASATAGDKFKVAFGNLKESVGTALLPTVDKLFTALTPLATQLTSKIGPAFKSIGGFIGQLVARFNGAGGGVDGFKKSLSDAKPFLDLTGSVIRTLGRAIIFYIPIAVKQFQFFAKSLGVIGKVAIGLYNNGFRPTFISISRGFSKLLRGAGDLFSVLGHVPGFGWAKSAAIGLKNASKTADGFAASIKRIPTKKDVKIKPLIGSTAAIENALNRLTRDRTARIIVQSQAKKNQAAINDLHNPAGRGVPGVVAPRVTVADLRPGAGTVPTLTPASVIIDGQEFAAWFDYRQDANRALG